VQFLKDDYTYLAVEIIRGETINYALLEIPSDKVPRFVNLPPEAPRRRKPMILLDNILRYCLDDIFKGFFDYDALNAYSMKMTRDAEYDLVHEMESSLMELMSSSLKQRLTAEPVRFVYQRDMPDTMVEMLRDKLSISTTTQCCQAGATTILKTLSASRTSVKPIWSTSRCRACVTCGLINSATDLTPFANATCCFTIRTIPLNTCWNYCVRPLSTRACWQSKSISTVLPKIRALLTP
jgi:polyphosphate kinase